MTDSAALVGLVVAALAGLLGLVSVWGGRRSVPRPPPGPPWVPADVELRRQEAARREGEADALRRAAEEEHAAASAVADAAREDIDEADTLDDLLRAGADERRRKEV